MNRNTLIVLKALTKHPRTSDRAIAKGIGLSQPTVTRTRSKLVNKGLIKFVAIPNIEAIGYETVAISEIYEETEDTEMRKQIQEDNHIVFAAKNADRIFMISAHKDYADLVLFHAKYPITTTISLATTILKIMKPLDFSQLINHNQ